MRADLRSFALGKPSLAAAGRRGCGGGVEADGLEASAGAWETAWWPRAGAGGGPALAVLRRETASGAGVGGRDGVGSRSLAGPPAWGVGGHRSGSRLRGSILMLEVCTPEVTQETRLFSWLDFSLAVCP